MEEAIYISTEEASFFGAVKDRGERWDLRTNSVERSPRARPLHPVGEAFQSTSCPWQSCELICRRSLRKEENVGTVFEERRACRISFMGHVLIPTVWGWFCHTRCYTLYTLWSSKIDFIAASQKALVDSKRLMVTTSYPDLFKHGWQPA